MSIRRIHKKLMHHTRLSFAALMALMIGVAYVSSTAYSKDHYPKKVYYVSIDGDDANPGTLQEPWRTIQKASNTLVGGETVFVREGVYEEFVQIRNSGSALDGYITFQAYPGERPVLEGKNLKPTSDNSSLLLIQGASYIVVQGFEIRGLTTDSANDYISGMKVRGGGSNILIADNDIHRISNFSSKGNAHGLIVNGDSLTPISTIKITGNEVHHLVSGSSESLTLDGNVKDFVVEYNTVHDNNNIGIDIIGHYKTCSGLCQDQARNGVVAHNVVYNIDTSTNPAYGGLGHRAAAGIYVDGGTNIIVENNEVFNSNFGIELASEIYGKATSNVVLRNNYLHHNQGAGIIMGGSDSDNGGARNNVIANNTLYMNDTMNQGYGEVTLQNYNVNNVFANNIIYTFPKKKFIKNSEKTGNGNIIDYNLYFREDGVNSTSWRYDGVSYKTWDDFKSGTGFDQHSLFADPSFIDIAKYGPYLSNQSSAINEGTLQYDDSMKIDYYKLPRIAGSDIDIGASEFTFGTNHSIPDPRNDKPSIHPEELIPIEDPSLSDEPFVDSTLPVNITIDGIGEDWASIQELSTSSSNVRSMKAFVANDLLYVLITGNLLTEKGQLYIDVDSNGTVFEAPYWSGSRSAYLIENGVLYKYSGKGGTNWNWSKVTSYRNTGHYAAKATVVEYAIPLADIGGTKDDVSIGYVWNDSIADKLPSANKMEPIHEISEK